MSKQYKIKGDIRRELIYQPAVLSHADTVLMVIAQRGLSLIGASIVNTKTLYKRMDIG